MKKVWLVGLLLLPVVFLVSCGSDKKSDVKVASIQQVLGNTASSIQSNALYHFEKEKLNVLITFSPFQDPNLEPSSSEFKKTFQNDLEMFNKDFPNEALTEKDYDSQIEKEFKDVVFKIDDKAKEVTLTSKEVKKVFKMSDSNDKRLIDAIGNEYELVIDEK